MFLEKLKMLAADIKPSILGCVHLEQERIARKNWGNENRCGAYKEP
jgi:hypothetical protein